MVNDIGQWKNRNYRIQRQPCKAVASYKKAKTITARDLFSLQLVTMSGSFPRKMKSYVLGIIGCHRIDQECLIS